MKKEKVASFEEIFTMENLLKAHFLCRRGKQHKKEVISFELNLFSNLTRLQKSLLDGTYSIPKYRKFYVQEPKLRLIESLPYKHRIVQRVLCENLFKPVFERHFIYDNCACRENKGTLFALNRLKKAMIEFCANNEGGWFVVCDIRKYFQNINHEILFEKLGHFGFDEKTMRLIFQYINSTGTESGLPIGNQVSQWFALLFLDEFDKFAKSTLKQKSYIRYMDDFVLFFKTKDEIGAAIEQIGAKLKVEKLELKKNLRSGMIRRGIPFLGFISYYKKSFFRRVKKESRSRMKKNVKLLHMLRRNNLIEEELFSQRMNCYLSHLVHSNEHFFREKMLRPEFFVQGGAKLAAISA